MQPQTLRRLLFTLPGVVLAIAAIALARPLDGSTPMPAGPFGFAALAVVQVLALWPAADLFASFWAPRGTARRGVAIGSLAVALVLLSATYELGNAAWPTMRGPRSIGFAEGWFFRTAWAAALLLPWCFAARSLFPKEFETDPASPRERWLTLLCALLVAFALPAGYAKHLFRRETIVLEANLSEGRFAGMVELAARLIAAGSEQPVGDVALVRVHNDLARMIEQYREQLAIPLTAKAGEEQVVQRAALHAALGEYDPALRLVEPIAAESLSAGLLKASVLDDLGKNDEAAQQFRAVIALARAKKTPAAEQALVQAYDGLAETLRDRRHIADAEAAYFEAITSIPAAEPHFRFQLGRHYALGGRSQAALMAFQRAAELDPEHFGLDRPEMQQQIRPLQEGTPSCLLPLPMGRTPNASGSR